MQAYIRPWVTVLFGWFRGRRDLILENAALRQQLAMYERRRPDIQNSDRLWGTTTPSVSHIACRPASVQGRSEYSGPRRRGAAKCHAAHSYW